VLGGLRVPKRRDDWRLGRFVAKRAVAARVELPWTDIEILAAPDGAPEPWHGEHRLPLSLSFSHRAGCAAAALAPEPMLVGCDLELVEPRSAAFVTEWLAPSEQALVGRFADPAARALVANLVWTGKEAAAKVLREGLRLEVRQAEVSFPAGLDEGLGAGVGGAGPWYPIEVHCHHERVSYTGWWCVQDGVVLSVLTDPGWPEPPQLLEG
jgi:4'-phosphopantetheinyl transferase